MTHFHKGDTFTCSQGKAEILDLLGEGGQGEVYLASLEGRKLAFKYYKEIPSDDFKYNLKTNIQRGSPSPSFLWPLYYVEFEDGGCGYFMELRGKNFVSFVSYLTGNSHFSSTKTMLKWCIALASSFKLLHEKGYSYQDLNDGSFFLDPDNGALLICDNDNVTADKRSLGVLGKMRYMAPEIVRGDENPLTKSPQMPDTHSDRFSLAIILFLTLCLGNPFEGERLKKYAIVDEKAEYELFGANPVYIYSEQDKSNRPIRGYHSAVLRRYPLLPSYIKDAFHRTFVDGLKDRENGRTTELEWIKALCLYRDELLTCSCGKEYAYGFYEKHQATSCPYCKAKTKRFVYLRMNKAKIALEPGKYLYKPHLDKYSSDYNAPIAKIVANAKNPSLWGIKLALDHDVLIKDAKGNEKTIAKDGVIPILSNLKIKFADHAIGELVLSND